MFDALLKSKFYSKSKSGIKLTKTRIEMIKRKRNAMQKYLKNDISDLLRNGLDSNAYGRVEGLWNELNLSSCYDSVDNFCMYILSHLANMYKQRECPEECREAVASLMFAAARFADLPELRKLRTAFTERYGTSIVCYANKELVNKLKGTPPTKDMKLQLMQDIASESGIEWNSKALEQKLYKIENLPSFERMEKVGVEGKYRGSSPCEGAEDPNEIKHVGVDSSNRKGKENEPQTLRSTTGEEDDEKPFYYKPFRPPYTKSSLTVPPTGSDTKVSDHAKTPAHIHREEDRVCQGESRENFKPVPKSVRRRFLKPQVDTNADQEGENKSSSSGRRLEPVATMPSPQQAADGNTRSRDAKDKGRDGPPTRASSFPNEPSSAETPKKGHARAASLQDENLHIHPKLPDYDDFVARLAAFRGDLK